MAPNKKPPRPMPSTHKAAPQRDPVTKPPAPAMPSTHKKVAAAPAAPPADETRYRVRDKDFVKVWGEDLSRGDAEKLKLSVTSTGKSRSARLEPMTAPTPATSPSLAVAQTAALAAARQAAQEAQARADERARRFVPPPPLPEAELADDAEEGDLDTNIDLDVDDLLADVDDAESALPEESAAPPLRTEPPWTEDQVASLNLFQSEGRFHPFTGKRKENGEETVLIATKDGWVEELGGPVVQTWAHAFMADGSWMGDIPKGSEDVASGR